MKIDKNVCAWDFLYSYVFGYYFGEKPTKNGGIIFCIFQVTDTGRFDSEEADKDTDISTFNSEENSISKLIFLVEKKINGNDDIIWKDGWVDKNILKNNARMSATLKPETLDFEKNGNTQIIYSFPLDRFLNEETTVETLNEFIKYCNGNGVSELQFV